jgi:transketolase
MSEDIRDIFFEELIKKMRINKKIILLSVDMGSQIVNDNFKYIREQYFNIGVSEQNAISVAAGLSKRKFIPFVYGISTFIFNRPRAQIRHDSIIGNNPINIIGSGNGLTYPQDGPSHHSIDDFMALSSLPNSILAIPINKISVKKTLKNCLLSKKTNFIKLDKGQIFQQNFSYDNGFLYNLKNKKKWIITTGIQNFNKEFSQKYKDYSIGILVLTNAKENESFIKKYLQKFTDLVIHDETFTYGGLYSYISTILALKLSKNIRNSTMKNQFIQLKNNRNELRRLYNAN